MRLRCIGLLALLASCADPGQLEPPAPLVFKIVAGDNQEGAVKEYAAIPLTVLVVDGAGSPQGGLRVTWDQPVNGRAIPLSEATAATGRAEALFLFGDAEGPAEISARVPGGATVRFRLRAAAASTGVPFDSFEVLDLTTYEGSGQTVHPDYARTPGFAFSQLLAITPYPGGDAAYENPSIFAGRSHLLWPVPVGVINPLARPSPGNYLSDPDIVFVPEAGELWLYYRAVDSQNRIYLIQSRDGLLWSPPQEVAAAVNHRLISPAVVHRGPDEWWMWSVDGKAGCSDKTSSLEVRRSTDGIRWGPPVPAPISHDGLTPWHIDVQWIPTRHEFWAVYNGKAPGSCATGALFLATSPDGIAWTPRRKPLMSKGIIPEFKDIVYRATFRYDAAADDLWLWVSGASHGADGWTWSTALQRRRGSEALRAAPMQGALKIARPSVELIDWP